MICEFVLLCSGGIQIGFGYNSTASFERRGSLKPAHQSGGVSLRGGVVHMLAVCILCQLHGEGKTW